LICVAGSVDCGWAAISNEWSVTVVFGLLFGLETATTLHSLDDLGRAWRRCATADPDIYYW
jgi:hypothetical protein